jgi:hypothetical protein
LGHLPSESGAEVLRLAADGRKLVAHLVAQLHDLQLDARHASWQFLECTTFSSRISTRVVRFGFGISGSWTMSQANVVPAD